MNSPRCLLFAVSPWARHGHTKLRSHGFFGFHLKWQVLYKRTCVHISTTTHSSQQEHYVLVVNSVNAARLLNIPIGLWILGLLELQL